jgi:polyhydroxyalkanoate synthesis repressor PhaR
MPIIIKRYQNRKLYNTRSKRYITLEEIENLIKNEEEIKVIDNKTGNDITAVTLSQIIFELEKNHTGFLPMRLLLSLVQSGGNKIEDIRKNIFDSLNLLHYYDSEIEKRIKYLIASGELSQEEGSNFLTKMLAASQQIHSVRWNVEEKINEYIKDRQVPSENDYLMLIQKIDEISKQVDEINSKQ